jgi:hypothetical protein
LNTPVKTPRSGHALKVHPMITNPEDLKSNVQKSLAEVCDRLGVQIPEVFLPRAGVDLQKWAVIACDQFTSQPQYWQAVENLVGDAPSTLNLILPELYLEGPEEEQRVCRAQDQMRAYLESGLLEGQEGLVYVERTVNGKCRKGLMLCLDLERYDYSPGSQSLIRATEGTIVERIPPRMRIRVGAALELPHILVLIDDPELTVIEPLSRAVSEPGSLEKIYDFDLMLDSGHLSGYQVKDSHLAENVIAALEKLAEPAAFSQKYGVGPEHQVLLFAMGDGNHSLATAKNTWERIKPMVGMDHPARYALVEIENVHDAGLEFEPIHRVLFNVHKDFFAAMQNFFGSRYSYYPSSSCDQMCEDVEKSCPDSQVIGLVFEDGYGVVEIENPTFNLAVGTFQAFLDDFLKSRGAERIDYVHGFDVVCELGTRPGNVGVYLPCMDKNALFKTVILDGALPRKTFSMGEAREKRFYMECRKIT